MKSDFSVLKNGIKERIKLMAELLSYIEEYENSPDNFSSLTIFLERVEKNMGDFVKLPDFDFETEKQRK